MHQTQFIGNNMPISVYGLTILLLVVINPLLARLRPRLALSGREVAVMLALTLAACCIPGSGLMRTFTSSLIMPYFYEHTSPAWQKPNDPTKPLYWRTGGIVEKIPAAMLADVNKDNENEVLSGFIQGKGVGNRHITMEQVPWRAWIRPLAFWIPLILSLWIGLLGLALVVHRQWSDHEQLPYPIAAFTNTLLPDDGETAAPIFRNRLFWIGAGAVMLIHFNNYACLWFPKMVPIPIKLNFLGLAELFPTFIQGGGWSLLTPTLFFTVIAFAYILASDVSLALGLGPYLWCLVAGVLAGYGISVYGSNGESIINFISFGAYIGVLLVLIYTGRRYYYDVLRRSVGLPVTNQPDPNSIWGARLFILAMGVFVAYASIFGKLDWQFSVILACHIILTFLVMSRIVAETGIFFIKTVSYPYFIYLGLFGAPALGPQTMLIIGIMTVVLLIDPREAFMPFMANSLKLLDLRKIMLAKAAKWAIAALLIGFAVAIPVTLYFQYDRGANMSDGWATVTVPKMPIEETVMMEQRLQSQGLLAEAAAISGWGHFRKMAPSPRMLLVLGIGAGLVLLLTAARLRWTRWPIHPVMFLIWNTYPGQWFAPAFLVGWLVKSLVTKYGGHTAYRRLKPLMFGLIAGELTAGVLIIIIGAVYFFVTGRPPKSFFIFPG
ncbi:MAG: hypothetical protein PHW60_16005 [Kiritimatiellae bacterium]|nr:hypothetical protein [Kiritimatiellia bacterium]